MAGRCVSLIGVALLVGVPTAGCGHGSGQASPGTASGLSATTPVREYTDRQAARLFVSAVRRYEGQIAGDVDAGYARADEQVRSCTPHSAKQDQFRIRRVGFSFGSLMGGKLIADEYISLAKTLREIPTQNAALKKVARLTTIVAGEAAAKMQGADIDACRYLREHEETGSQFFYKLADAPFALFGINRQVLLNVEKAKTPAFYKAMMKLGLSFNDRLALESITLYL